MAGTIGWVLILLVGAVVALVTLQPSWWSGAVGGAQLSSFRSAQIIMLVAMAVLAAFALRWRTGRRHVAAAVTILLVGAAGHAVILGQHGWSGTSGVSKTSDPTPATAAASLDDGREAGDVVVLSFNTFGGANGSQLAQLIADSEADIVVLPETRRATAADTVEQLSGLGISMTAMARNTTSRSSTATAMLVRKELGSYDIASVLPTEAGAFLATSTGGSSPFGVSTLAAVHPQAPVAPSVMSTWRNETRLVATTCNNTPGMIMAGDFNATIDHPGLRNLGHCVDAAQAAGAAAIGTWPASVPTWLSAPIDHVLVDDRAWQVVAFHVLPATAGSDHRPIVAVLRHR